MKDFAGREINIGDDVAFVSRRKASKYLVRSSVVLFTNQMVKLASDDKLFPHSLIVLIKD